MDGLLRSGKILILALECFVSEAAYSSALVARASISRRSTSPAAGPTDQGPRVRAIARNAVKPSWAASTHAPRGRAGRDFNSRDDRRLGRQDRRHQGIDVCAPCRGDPFGRAEQVSVVRHRAVATVPARLAPGGPSRQRRSAATTPEPDKRQRTLALDQRVVDPARGTATVWRLRWRRRSDGSAELTTMSACRR